jgi:hypothetical protein
MMRRIRRACNKSIIIGIGEGIWIKR